MISEQRLQQTPVCVCVALPGSQQQRQALISALLVETVRFPGDGVEEAGVCGGPLVRNGPETPRQQRLEL